MRPGQTARNEKSRNAVAKAAGPRFCRLRQTSSNPAAAKSHSGAFCFRTGIKLSVKAEMPSPRELSAAYWRAEGKGQNQNLGKTPAHQSNRQVAANGAAAPPRKAASLTARPRLSGQQRAVTYNAPKAPNKAPCCFITKARPNSRPLHHSVDGRHESAGRASSSAPASAGSTT